MHKQLTFFAFLLQIVTFFLTNVVNSATYMCQEYQCNNEDLNFESSFDINNPNDTNIGSALCELTCEGFESCMDTNINTKNIISFSLLCYGLLSCDNIVVNVSRNYGSYIAVEFSADMYSASSTLYLEKDLPLFVGNNNTYMGNSISIFGKESDNIDVICSGNTYNDLIIETCHNLFVESGINTQTELKFNSINDGHDVIINNNNYADLLFVHCNGANSCYNLKISNYYNNKTSIDDNDNMDLMVSNSSLINIDCNGINSCNTMLFDNMMQRSEYDPYYYHNISLNCISSSSCSNVKFDRLYNSIFNVKCIGDNQCNYMSNKNNENLISWSSYCNGNNSCQHFNFTYDNNNNNNNSNFTFEFNGNNNGNNMFISLSNIKSLYIKCYNYSCHNATIIVSNANSVYIDCDNTSCNNPLQASFSSITQLTSSLTIQQQNNNNNNNNKKKNTTKNTRKRVGWYGDGF